MEPGRKTPMSQATTVAGRSSRRAKTNCWLGLGSDAAARIDMESLRFRVPGRAPSGGKFGQCVHSPEADKNVCPTEEGILRLAGHF
jgi:hypothetical protein